MMRSSISNSCPGAVKVGVGFGEGNRRRVLLRGHGSGVAGVEGGVGMKMAER